MEGKEMKKEEEIKKPGFCDSCHQKTSLLKEVNITPKLKKFLCRNCFKKFEEWNFGWMHLTYR